MELDLELLTEDVGLKCDGQVILGKTAVGEFIAANQERFTELDLSRIEESHMLYGYNNLGEPFKIGFSGEGIQRIVVVAKDEGKRRLKIEIAYDGHQYSGFQIQEKHLTVQGVLTEIVSSINGAPTLIQGCSRTDSGVHANSYIIHFDTERDISDNRWKELLNYRLPPDIRVKQVHSVHPLFHSRYDVYKKKYSYRIRIGEIDPFKANYEWAIDNIDLAKIQANLPLLVGTHDFQSFCKGHQDDTIRTMMKAKMKVKNDEVTLIFEGDGFLRYMVRIIVYALIDIAKGNLDKNISDLLAEKSRLHTKHMAPASGLYLEEVTY